MVPEQPSGGRDCGRITVPEAASRLDEHGSCPTSWAGSAALLGAFRLRDEDGPVQVSSTAQRVVAFLALQAKPVRRVLLAGTLWPEATDQRAGASLRSALWKLRRPGADLVVATGTHLALASGVEVDIHRLSATAHHIADVDPGDAATELIASFQDELLPGWYDDWVILWQERWRQVRLHALEELAATLATAGRFLAASEAAMAAVQAEPLRDAANRALIRVHLAEGNSSEALRQFHRYRQLLQAELGIAPSPAMRSLVEGLTAR
jgi:DNA-binding SARP family transcriptional activator